MIKHSLRGYILGTATVLAVLPSVSDFQNLLDDYSTEFWYINYAGSYTNHLAQGAIALYRLGASKARIQRYVDLNVRKLLPADRFRDENAAKVREVDLIGMLGRKESYYPLLDFYKAELTGVHRGSMDSLIRARLPLLIRGLLADFLHGLIHLGYGYHINNAQMVCEGLAWLHAKFRPAGLDAEVLKQPMRNGAKDLLVLLDEMKADSLCRVGSRIGRPSGIASRYGNKLLGFVDQIDLGLSSDGHIDAFNTADAVVDMAMRLYINNQQKNNFYILHGVTSAWSLKQLLPLISDQRIRREALRSHLVALLAVYIARGCPTVTESSRETASPVESWERIVADTVSLDRDPHIYKMVQVARNMARAHPSKDGFYRKVALFAERNSLTF